MTSLSLHFSQCSQQHPTVGTSSRFSSPISTPSIPSLINSPREQRSLCSILVSSHRRFRNNRLVGVTMASISEGTLCQGVDVAEGNGGLPKVVLKSTDGSEVEIYLFGACITSWKVDGKDLLFVRPDAVFNGQKPISGGIPHCFPQFGPGALQQHGFGRNMTWSINHSENAKGHPFVILELKDDKFSRSMWDFSFLVLYKIFLRGGILSTEMIVKNIDSKPFSFTTALHSYFRASVTGASVKGLRGCKTLNKDPDPKNPMEGIEEREAITFPGFVDCIYLDTPNEVILENGLGHTISIKDKNWADAVLWNPHMQMEASYKDFVCVENAKIFPVELGPGQEWTAEQELSLMS